MFSRYETVKMNEKNENMIENDNGEGKKDLCKELINGITCREDLYQFFEHNDHSINRIHFSKVNFFYNRNFFE